MTGLKLLLVFSLLGGVFAEQCDIGDFSIDDFSNHVVLTNASESQDALLSVTFDHGAADVFLKAGASKTFRTIGTTQYGITVYPANQQGGDAYRKALRSLRDRLQNISLDSQASAELIADALVGIFVIESALQQLDGDGSAQSCGHAIGEGVDSLATVTWTGSVGTSGIDSSTRGRAPGLPARRRSGNRWRPGWRRGSPARSG